MHYNFLKSFFTNEWWRLVALIPVIGFITLLFLGFDGLFGQDSYEYLRYAKRLKIYISGGAFPGDIVWPKAYLGILSFGLFFVKGALAGQLLSFCCFLGTALALYKSLVVLYKEERIAKIYVTLAFLLSGYMFRSSVVVMSDAFSVFFLSIAFYHALIYTKLLNFKNIALFSLAVSLGFFGRYAVLVPLAPIILWVVYSWIKGKQWTHAFVLLIFIGVYLINAHLEGSGSLLLNHHMVEQWSISNFFETEFFNTIDPQQPSASFLLPNLLYNAVGLFHPGFFILSPFLIFFSNISLKPRNETVILVLSCGLYLIFLSGLIFQSSRYISLIYPLFLMLFFPAFIKFWGNLKRWNHKLKQLFILLIIGLQLTLLTRSMWPSYKMNKLEREVTDGLSKFEGSTLYSFELDIALQQRGVKMNYKSLWEQQYTSFEIGDLVLFNPERVNQTYTGKNPMVNWERLSTSHSLATMESFKDGWKLYKIEKN